MDDEGIDDMPDRTGIERGVITDVKGPVGNINRGPEGPQGPQDIVDRTNGDWFETSSREIQRLEDEILLLKLDGVPEETIKPLRDNLQKEKETIDYLNGERNPDSPIQIEKAKYSTEGIRNEDLTIVALIDKWADAKIHNDKTIDGDISDEILKRIMAENSFSSENKQAVLDRILKMLDSKINEINSKLTPETTNIEPKSTPDIKEKSDDITTTGSETQIEPEPDKTTTTNPDKAVETTLIDDDGMGVIESVDEKTEEEKSKGIDDYIKQLNANGLDLRTYKDVKNDTLITGDNQDFLKEGQVPGQLGFVNIEGSDETKEPEPVPVPPEPKPKPKPEDDGYVPDIAGDAGEPWHQGEGAKEPEEPEPEPTKNPEDDGYVPDIAGDAGEPWHQGEGAKEPEEPEPIPTPTEKTPEEKKVDEYEKTIKGGVGFVGQRFDAESIAHDVAMEMNTKKRGEGGRFHRFVYRLWQDGIASNIYHRKYTREAMKAIEKNGLHANENKSNSEVQQMVDATIEQFLADEKQETIHTATGEKREFLSADHELAKGSRDLIRRFCLPESNPDHIDAVKLQELRTLMLGDYKIAHPDDDMIDKTIEIDNLLSVAEAAKGLYESGKSADYVDKMLAEMRIAKGESRSLQRNEAHLNKVERTIEKLQHTRFGALVGPETIAITVSIAAGIAKVGSQSVLSAAARFIGLTGASAGVTSGIRKNMEMKVMRAANARDNEVGKVWDPNDRDNKLRKELDPSMYERRTAVDLTNSLQQARERAVSEPTRENIESLLAIQADIDARVSFSDTNKKGLITYSSMTDLGRERLTLDRTRAESRAVLEGLLTPDMRTQLGIEASANIHDITNSRSSEVSKTLYEDVEKKDKVFNKLKRKKVFKAVIIGTISGIVSGLVVQEAMAALNPHTSGLVEQLWHAKNIPDAKTGIQHESLLHGIFGEHTTTEHIKPNADFVKQMLGKTEINITSDSTIRQDPNGLFSIIDRDGVTRVSGLELDPSTGDLTPQSLELLSNAKHSLIDRSFDTIIEHKIPVSGSDEWLKTVDPNELTRIHHVDWWRNLKHIFDHNELKVWWGGQNNCGFNDEGFVFDASRMTSTGSWNDHFGTVNAAELIKKGAVKMLVYADRGDGVAFEFPVSTTGQGVIPYINKAAELFSIENGHAVNAGMVEFVTTTGIDSKTGVLGIIPLATHVGDKVASGWEIIKDSVHNAVYDIVSNGSDVIRENFTEVIPGIPFYKNERLGAAKSETGHVRGPEAGMYYGGMTLESAREWLKSRPYLLKPRYFTTSTEVGSDGRSREKRTWHEADGSPVVRSVDREKSTINEYLDRQRREIPEHVKKVENIASSMAPMSEKCRVSINVPAYMEGKNLRHWLEQFSHQVDKKGNPIDPETYELNIIINRAEGKTPDNSVEVVDKFIADYKASHGGVAPKVNYCDVIIDKNNANVGYARKIITDVTLLRSVNRPRQDGCLYIESEDADVVKADELTVANLIEKLDQEPHLDAVRGTQGRDMETLKKNDLLLLEQKMWNYFEMEAGLSDLRDPTNPNWSFNWNKIVTGGWNTAYSAEAYAAIDGYDSVVAGEDMAVGAKISMIRGDGNTPNVETVGEVLTFSDSSPRRFIEAIISGKGAYDNFGDTKVEERIRNMTTDQLLDKIKGLSRINEKDRNNIEKFETVFNNMYINCQRNSGGSPERAKRMARQILFLMGLKEKNGDYEIKDGKIIIKNWKRVKDVLDDNRKYSLLTI